MNTKKNKNKNKSKPVNLDPPQKEEIVQDIKEKVELDMSVKTEERVPEIVSEITSQMPEKGIESDAPKKPKRNRGKKKKCDKESEEQKENLQSSKQESSKTDAEQTNTLPELKEDEKKISEVQDQFLQADELSLKAVNVTPTARKKQNKKSHNPSKIEEPAKIININPETDTINIESTELELKTPKKKNKKKKRTDSEKSEDVLAVTAAFQKLLETKEDKNDSKDKSKETTTETIPQKDLSKESEGEICKKNILQTELQTDPTINIIEPLKESSMKNKKKTKKDKKLHQKTDDEPHTTEPEYISEPEKDKEKAITLADDLYIKDKSGHQASEIKCEKAKETQSMSTETSDLDIKHDIKVNIAEPFKIESQILETADEKTENMEIPENIEIPSKSTFFDIKSDLKKESDKKKNKKDKIQPPKQKSEMGNKTQEFTKVSEESDAINEPLIPRPSTPPTDNKTSIISVDITNLDEDNLTIVDNTILKEKSLSSKAKIAKPVEKNHQVKLDVQVAEENRSVSEKAEDSLSDIKIPDKTPSALSAETEVTKPSEVIQDVEADLIRTIAIKEKNIEKEETSEKTVKTQKNYILAEEKVKKRKKSPKPPSSRTGVIQDKSHEITLESLGIEKTSKSKDIIVLQEKEIIPENKIIETLDIEKHLELQQSSEAEKKEASDSQKLPSEENQLIEKKNEIQIPETTTSKKRKKSPKPPKNKAQENPSKEAEDIEPNIDDISKFERSTTTCPSALQDIEIRSVQTEESEGSVCDIIPDIDYPRSSSEVDDNNNNASIREVSSDSNKLNISLDTPLVQSSGETPNATPDLTLIGVQIIEINDSCLKSCEEKTDLKSKVMEVNKDMEELRLSIERSLAELTAIEKSEENTEKQYEDVTHKNSEEKDSKIEQKSIIEDKGILQSPEQYKKTGVEKLAEIIAEQTLSESKTTTTLELESKLAETKTKTENKFVDKKELAESSIMEGSVIESQRPPVQPPRRENKGKSKSKKKGKQEIEHSAALSTPASTTQSSTTGTGDSKNTQEGKKEEKSDSKSNKTQEKTKQQSDTFEKASNEDTNENTDQTVFETIETFEDALTSSGNADDVNKSFEIIAKEADDLNKLNEKNNHPKINITAPIEDDDQKDKQGNISPISPPKNLLGHPDIPVRLNKPDYKKERNKTPNTKQARVKIKDDVPVEVNKHSKESQTDNKNRFLKDRKSICETITCMTAEDEDFVYKYSFRKVFLPSACHVCKKDLKQSRIPCNFCNLVFYCSPKHKDEDYQQHQGFCFAVSTIVHLKDQKHIYGDSKGISGHDYRLLRMQMIVSSEKVLKRKLEPWEQEALLYPRLCADISCREWRQGKLRDCEGCGQISYCADKPDHLPNSHQRWCKSYSLYHKLVCYQQTKGRLEPKLPSRVMTEVYQIPDNFNEVLASMYEEKIDMNDIQYAALTQLATAPLTAVYCHQLYTNKMNASCANGVLRKSSFTIHVVGAELQFEADALNKWEIFFLHLRPDISTLRVVLIGQDLNPSNLPLELLGKIKLCKSCHYHKRKVVFDFQDKKSYQDYWATYFILPDLVCAFNPGIQRSSVYNGRDTWPATIKYVTKLKVPFIITSYTMSELVKDLERVKECSDVELSVISEPKYNAFGSVRPDRNFISDDEIPLLFKNYCFTVVCGAL